MTENKKKRGPKKKDIKDFPENWEEKIIEMYRHLISKDNE